MSCRITFEKHARFLGQTPELRVTMKFEHCTCDQFNDWLNRHETRLHAMSQNCDYDVGFSDNVICFWPNKD